MGGAQAQPQPGRVGRGLGGRGHAGARWVGDLVGGGFNQAVAFEIQQKIQINYIEEFVLPFNRLGTLLNIFTNWINLKCLLL